MSDNQSKSVIDLSMVEDGADTDHENYTDMTVRQEDALESDYSHYNKMTVDEKHCLKLVVILKLDRKDTNGNKLPSFYDELVNLLRRCKQPSILSSLSETSELGKLKILITKRLSQDIMEEKVNGNYLILLPS